MTGFVLLDKPEGITSFGSVARIRRLFQTKKCGHTGTLDPLATGVLPIAVGACTRFIELIPSSEKEYEATFCLGIRTDTLDVTGRIIAESDARVGENEIRDALSSFEGEITQVPPMFSAIKQDGKRLYELAREGKEVERKERRVKISRIELIEADEAGNRFRLRVRCSAGTYIRTLIDDLGEKLETHATMTALRRTMSNGVRIESCFSLEQLEELKEKGELSSAVIPVDSLLAYNKLTVSEAQGRRFQNGGELSLDRLKGASSGGMFGVYSPGGDFLGVGRAEPSSGELKVVRVYNRNNEDV